MVDSDRLKTVRSAAETAASLPEVKAGGASAIAAVVVALDPSRVVLTTLTDAVADGLSAVGAPTVDLPYYGVILTIVFLVFFGVFLSGVWREY